MAYLAPDDIIVDVRSIRDKEQRMAMCKRINELRRDRVRHLASPQAAGFYDEDGTKFVPMSRCTERHFWDVFHKLPMATQDATKWKAILKYLDGCPEKPKAGPTPRDVEWTSPELLEPPADSDSRMASLPVSAKGSSMDALRRLAESSPQKPPVLPEGVDGNEAFQDWVRKQVDLDTANLTLQSFELETKNHRLSRKMSAAKALSGLAPFEAMSDLYQTVYRIYLRKLERLCANLPARSKETTALKKLCDCLNVESDGSIASLLARLRATDIMRKPM